ncbi:MAG: CD0415/CD1112 family protein [Clostridia bacterium]|nr:CD0415/CD1112 family protein [Clostridia bacterium]
MNINTIMLMLNINLLSINPINKLLDMVMEWFKQTVIDISVTPFVQFFTDVRKLYILPINIEAKKIIQFSLDDITQIPSNYNGTVYELIKNLSKDFILPIAVVFMTFFLIYELVHTLLNDNKVNDNYAELIIKWLIKFLISILLINYSFEIINLIFVLATSAASKAISLLNGTEVEEIIKDMDVAQLSEDVMKDLSGQGLGSVLLFSLVSFIVSLISQLLIPLISFVIICRFVYIYLYMSMAPIAMSALIIKEWNSIGVNYMKNIAALAFQGFLIVGVIAIYYGTIISFVDPTQDLQNAAVQLLAYSIVLIYALFKTDNIAKSIFTAH